jgi:hypothetical protein
MLDIEDDPTRPHNFRLVTDLVGKHEAVPQGAEHVFFVKEANMFTVAESHDCWRWVIMEDLDSIKENGTWTLNELPPEHRPIGLKWVFKTKRDATGAIITHTNRLVAKGYVQREGVDSDKFFAPVAHLDSMRLMAAVSARDKWQLHHLDVKSAFLNGDL